MSDAAWVILFRWSLLPLALSAYLFTIPTLSSFISSLLFIIVFRSSNDVNRLLAL